MLAKPFKTEIPSHRNLEMAVLLLQFIVPLEGQRLATKVPKLTGRLRHQCYPSRLPIEVTRAGATIQI